MGILEFVPAVVTVKDHHQHLPMNAETTIATAKANSIQSIGSHCLNAQSLILDTSLRRCHTYGRFLLLAECAGTSVCLPMARLPAQFVYVCIRTLPRLRSHATRRLCTIRGWGRLGRLGTQLPPSLSSTPPDDLPATYSSHPSPETMDSLPAAVGWTGLDWFWFSCHCSYSFLQCPSDALGCPRSDDLESLDPGPCGLTLARRWSGKASRESSS